MLEGDKHHRNRKGEWDKGMPGLEQVALFNWSEYTSLRSWDLNRLEIGEEVAQEI